MKHIIIAVIFTLVSTGLAYGYGENTRDDECELPETCRDEFTKKIINEDTSYNKRENNR